MTATAIKMVGDWEEARKFFRGAAKAPATVRSQLTKSTAQAALIVDRRIKEVFRKGGVPKWKPLSPITRRWHSDRQPLSDRGDLRNSIQPTQVVPGVWFVGIPRNARTKNAKTGGFTVYRIALVHEFGVWVHPSKGYLFVPLTRQMETAKRRVGIGARVQSVQGKRPKRGVDYVLVKHSVFIPPRPFVGPGVERAEKEVEQIMTLGLAGIFEAFSKG